MQDFPQTEIQKLRTVMFAELYKKSMSLNEVYEINCQISEKYPRTEEERRQKTESLMQMPEFIL
jgi:hypothetical protein